MQPHPRTRIQPAGATFLPSRTPKGPALSLPECPGLHGFLIGQGPPIPIPTLTTVYTDTSSSSAVLLEIADAATGIERSPVVDGPDRSSLGQH